MKIVALIKIHDICKFLCENLRLGRKKVVPLQINLGVLFVNMPTEENVTEILKEYDSFQNGNSRESEIGNYVKNS